MTERSVMSTYYPPVRLAVPTEQPPIFDPRRATEHTGKLEKEVAERDERIRELEKRLLEKEVAERDDRVRELEKHLADEKSRVANLESVRLELGVPVQPPHLGAPAPQVMAPHPAAATAVDDTDRAAPLKIHAARYGWARDVWNAAPGYGEASTTLEPRLPPPSKTIN